MPTRGTTRGRSLPAQRATRGRSSNHASATPPGSRTTTRFPMHHRSPSAESFPHTPDHSDSEQDDIPDTRRSTGTTGSRGRSPPPVLISPIKRRSCAAAPTINKRDDLSIWEMSDYEIIEAAKTTWRSDAYDHYNVSLQRELDDHGQPAGLTYVFTCKTCPQDHPSLFRPRSKTGEGTSNLVRTMNICLAAQGLPTPGSSSLDADLPVPYSPAAHRVFIALRSARSNRPFNAVTDKDYLGEVQMLRPGTVLPSPSTVSRDIKHIYAEMSRQVKEYFLALNCTIHLVLDGWTSPLVSAYLGLVVIWQTDGILHRSILEFIRLTQKHDGAYLAKVVAECLKRFGIDKQLFSVCMDNATNCDKLAKHLCDHIPTFRGVSGRLRCLAHIFNLIAKIFISFFFKKPKPKRAIGIARGARTSRFQRPGELNRDSSESGEEIVLDPGDRASDDADSESEENVAIHEEAEASVEEEEDEGQAIHNEHVAKTMSEKAIQYMEREKGIFLDPEDLKIAQQIFPRVSGLARRVHDSPTLKEKFDKLVIDDTTLEGNRRALVRRVPTRWNSDLDCLLSHFYFREVIMQLTAIPSLKLKAYRLSPAQWKIAEDVREVLLLFSDVTKIFSQADVPLVVDVIPTLEELREGMIAARDDNINDVSDIVKVGCQAGILLIDKYSTFSEDCDIYIIAIVMCPDRKLKWFKDHGRTPRQIKDIEKTVVNMWKNYMPAEDEDSAASTEASARMTRSRYAPAIAQAPSAANQIQTYLKEPLLLTSTIKEVGGYLKYWHNVMGSRPQLAQMALDFCSAPATSVDAERAFSTGRRQVNFMQTNMNSQTFKAQMAVGSWVNAPFYPGFKYVQDLLDKNVMAPGDENPFLVSNSPNL